MSAQEGKTLRQHAEMAGAWIMFLGAMDIIFAKGAFSNAYLLDSLGFEGTRYVFHGELGETITFGHELPDLDAVGEKYGAGELVKTPNSPPLLGFVYLIFANQMRKRALRKPAAKAT